MHKRLNALIISAIMVSSLLLPYTVSAKNPETTQPHEKKVVQVDTKDRLGMLEGHLGDIKTRDLNGVIQFFKENTDLFHIQNPESEIKVKSIKNDKAGNTHIKVQQVYKDMDIFAKEYIIHVNKDGCVYFVNGVIEPEISKKYSGSKESSNKISETKAIDIAKKTVNINKTIEEPKANRYLYNLDGEYIPVYEVKLSAVEPTISDWLVYVSCETGDIVKKTNRTHTSAATGQGIGNMGDTKNLNLDYSNGKYSMLDKTQSGTKIETYDGTDVKGNPYTPEINPYLPGKLYTKPTNIFNTEKDKSAVDAHAYARIVYDYYKNVYGRESLDNKGMTIKSSVHIGKNWGNAAWIGTQMIYGDGDGQMFNSFAAGVDLVGHEMTHAVDNFECDLKYADQPGALNESYSDIFGTLIEFYTYGPNANFLIGENIVAPTGPLALRDMDNPGNPRVASPQPAHMNNYQNMEEDEGGVHMNSGIPNKAASIIIKNLGPETAGLIYYDALVNNMTKDTDFHRARLALLKSAEGLFGRYSQQYYIVSSAFDAVGIY